MVSAGRTNREAPVIHGAPRSLQDLDARVASIEARILALGDLPGYTTREQRDLLHRIARHPLGRFLLLHRGLDAYWTHRVITHVSDGRPPSFDDAEWILFEGLPAVRATRDRFRIFQSRLQALVGPGRRLASVPCGFMDDLLSLDYRASRDARLTGVDLDPAALVGASALAAQRGLTARVHLELADAWSPDWGGGFHVVTSNGLTIYESDEGTCIALYRRFLAALQPGGVLVTSFLTPRRTPAGEPIWNMECIDDDLLALQAVVFDRLIEPRWAALRTHAETGRHLAEAGFVDIDIVDDPARMFPTVVARRPP